jgi:hypothetical protein
MGIKPPQEKFRIPDDINGIAMQALAAGRARVHDPADARTCHLPRFPCPVPGHYSDLLNCREILCAESLEFADFTAEARGMIEHVTLDDCFQPVHGNSNFGGSRS